MLAGLGKFDESLGDDSLAHSYPSLRSIEAIDLNKQFLAGRIRAIEASPAPAGQPR